MKDDRVFLLHILEATGRIASYVEGGRADFMARPIVQDAVIRNLEIIGEASKRVSPETRAEHPEIPRAKMSGMRDVLAHGYMAVDLEIVWDVVANRLSGVAEGLQKIVKE